MHGVVQIYQPPPLTLLEKELRKPVIWDRLLPFFFSGKIIAFYPVDSSKYQVEGSENGIRRREEGENLENTSKNMP